MSNDDDSFVTSTRIFAVGNPIPELHTLGYGLLVLLVGPVYIKTFGKRFRKRSRKRFRGVQLDVQTTLSSSSSRLCIDLCERGITPKTVENGSLQLHVHTHLTVVLT